MIKKITTGEYLKDYRTMTAQERKAYRKRVGEWLCTAGERLLALTDRPMARAQNLMTMSGRWDKEDCEAAHEGAVLMTALMAVTETWLPSQLWVKSAWRAVRKLTEELSSIHNAQFTIHNEADAQGKVGPNTRSTQSNQKTERAVAELGPKGRLPKQEPSGKPTGALQAKADTPLPTGKPTGALEAQGKTQGNHATESQGTLPAAVSAPLPTGKPQGTLIPARPKHIDQYAYLLPKGTQERAGAVRGLLRELDEAREKMRLLMEDVNAKPDARAAWARKATKIDATLKGIYRELDAEWEKLVKSGRVTVDALGNANVAPSPQNGEAQDTVAEMTSEQKARRRELRKWLIDLRRGKEGKAREKRIEQWKENWKEYLTLEPLEAALKDEKVVAAAAYFGVEINPDKQDDKQG